MSFNALNGLLSFLLSVYRMMWECSGKFQRPKRASVISTEAISKAWKSNMCFNALNGLLSFLP